MELVDRGLLEELCFKSQVKLPDSLESIVCTQEDASLKSPSVPAHYYRFLYALTALKKPKLWLELGTHTGISSACLAEGYTEGDGITVNILEELRMDCVRFNVEYFPKHDSLIPVDLYHKIDILFIDTDHDGKRCLAEFNLYRDQLAPNAIVMFDDISLLPCMERFWREFNPEGFEKFELPIHGWAAFGVLINKEAQEAQA